MVGKGPYIFLISLVCGFALTLLLAPAGLTFIASFMVYRLSGSSAVFEYPLAVFGGIVSAVVLLVFIFFSIKTVTP